MKPAEGAPGPIGVTWIAAEHSWNFALYSRHATGVTLLLYAAVDSAKPLLEVSLDPLTNKSGPVWHCRVSEDQAPEARYYAYRVSGVYDPSTGLWFNSRKILLDPFAPEIYFPRAFNRNAAVSAEANDGCAALGVLPRTAPVNLPQLRWRQHRDLIVYELHVKGFTARKNSGVQDSRRGTFAGLAEKIPYLKELGITAVELMPIHQADPQEGSYWGYMPLNFFSPNRSYASRPDAAAKEFRDMVDAFHAADIEVWLDVVYNHTSESGPDGPVYSYRGIDNQSWYLLQGDSRYDNSTGCGNTLRCDHPIVKHLILESLERWISLGVDGFRFDLASVLTRRSDGSVGNAALVDEISRLASRSGTRLIAEPWDLGAYMTGPSFPGHDWRQWNDRFRDDIRDFVRGVPGRIGALIQRLYGSDDLFPEDAGNSCRPFQSVNFVTAHDGFTLYDLVSYNQKHNEANGHNNTDGTDDNRSWNCGCEGDSSAPAGVLALRRRQVRNFFCLLMLANGTPMFCAGEEFLTTRLGNNNPYNQDNELNYIDWNLLDTNRDVFRFFQGMIAFRKAHPSIGRAHFWRGDVKWYGTGELVDFSSAGNILAWCLHGASVGDTDIYAMVNGSDSEEVFRIQEGEASDWTLVADTSLAPPADFVASENRVALKSLEYALPARSIVVFVKRAQSA